jgi:DNA-binding PadR family transcriptional regulator
MRRKAGALVPLEIEVCLAAADLASAGTREFHGYQLAKQMAKAGKRKSLATHGTLYRALARLAEMGMVTDRWEDPQLAARERRPVRRLYALTINGRRVAAWHRATAAAKQAPARAR